MNTFNFRILSLSLALAAILGLSGLATAAGPCCGPGMADISPEKKELIKKLHEDFYKSTEAVRQELISKRHELDAQLFSANPDEKRIQALAKEISDLRAKLYSARITLKGKLIKEGVTFGYGGCGMREGYGYGHGKRGGKGRGKGPCFDGPRHGMRGE